MTTSTETRAASPEALAEARASLAADKRRVAALSLFARRMSHDMSNFVTVVRTYSELLLADLQPATPTHDDVSEIHRAADAMIDYMQRIVRFARTTSASPGALLFDDAIADAVKASPASAQTRLQLASDSTVRIDATILADSVRELLTNASEASPPGAIINVRSWTETLPHAIIDGGVPIDAGKWAVMEVADEGPGFTAEMAAESMDPFVTSKNAVRGAGFGLALARSAAWSGHGQLATESNVGAKGAKVRFWLPVGG
ncbi:MAG: sensor histidine kinase [Gemmatimonas sp.]